MFLVISLPSLPWLMPNDQDYRADDAGFDEHQKRSTSAPVHPLVRQQTPEVIGRQSVFGIQNWHVSSEELRPSATFPKTADKQNRG
jgi:hypothetical protein